MITKVQSSNMYLLSLQKQQQTSKQFNIVPNFKLLSLVCYHNSSPQE